MRITRHAPDDDRVAILTGAYGIEHAAAPYVGVNHELPIYAGRSMVEAK